MRRRLKKIRLRSQRKDGPLDTVDSPPSSDTDSCEMPAAVLAEEEEDEEEQRGDAETAAFQDHWRTDSEVKGQLEVALLEKHLLQTELLKLRGESSVEALSQELDEERQLRAKLQQRLDEVLASRGEAMPAPPCQPSDSTMGTSTLLRWLQDQYSVYGDDFRFQPETEEPETEEPLSARRLMENMRRLKRGANPVWTFRRNMVALSNWQTFYPSAIAFTVYMYAAWHGWVIPMVLFFAILRLSLNYLISRGWRIEWRIVPGDSEPEEPPKDRSVSERFQLVVDVAQKAQNLFGKMSDILEKIKNLLMWTVPELTWKLYVALCVAFVASCLLPYNLLGSIMAVYAGIKFFVMDFIYRRCPRLRQRFDTPYMVWSRLPTDAQLRARWVSPQGSIMVEDGSRVYFTRRGAFHEVFNLPESERPLPACENGWRCYLINRDRRTPTDYIRNGFLYLTDNFLCFESSSSRSNSFKRNKVINLANVVDVQKYKVLSVLPGSGMGISIATPHTIKPLVFGALANRDEAFDIIMSQYQKVSIGADSEQTLPPSGRNQSRPGAV